MKRLIAISLSSMLLCASLLGGCAGQQESSSESSSSAQSSQEVRTPTELSSGTEATAPQSSSQGSAAQSGNGGAAMTSSSDTAQLSINGSTFTITLADNATATAFAGMLPLQVQMSELNGNEKYVYLDQSLPSNASNPGTIEAGDVMLYGDNCLVVFYESHPTTYTYTRIGKIADVAALRAAVGSGSIDASFSLA